MNKETLERTVELTRSCLEQFWQKNIENMVSYLSDDIIWIGAQQEQFRIGKEDTVADLYNIMKELQPCHLKNSEFYVMTNEANTCTICGRYLITTDDEVEYFLQAQQRCTIVWTKEDNSLKIKHFHVSNPIGEMKVAPGEHFVNNMGKMAKRYMENQLSLLRDNRRIHVTKEDDAICFIYLTEIMYLEAERKTTLIFTTNGMIRAKIAFIEIAGMLDEKFIQVHRSYIVNKDFVTHIITNKIIMADDKEIPVPARRFSSIKKKVIQEI